MFRNLLAAALAAVLFLSPVLPARASGKPTVSEQFLNRCASGDYYFKFYDCGCLLPVVEALIAENPGVDMGALGMMFSPEAFRGCLKPDVIAARARKNCDENFQFGVLLNNDKLSQEQLCNCHATEAVKTHEASEAFIVFDLPSETNELCGASPARKRR